MRYAWRVRAAATYTARGSAGYINFAPPLTQVHSQAQTSQFVHAEAPGRPCAVSDSNTGSAACTAAVQLSYEEDIRRTFYDGAHPRTSRAYVSSEELRSPNTRRNSTDELSNPCSSRMGEASAAPAGRAAPSSRPGPMNAVLTGCVYLQGMSARSPPAAWPLGLALSD